ncbi:MAG: deoxyribose-phosphate aldolase [Bacteroidales bacterium]|nr:MAG: deoxyribose-phosphate aldolase [Bacteroidales bacterium]
MVTKAEVAKMIDHSLLHPAMNDNDLREGCLLARKYNVASVCIKPYAVKTAVEILKGSEVKVGTVVGFPHGNSHIEVKVYETEKAISDGSGEIDLVINIGKVLSEDWKYIENEVKSIVDITKKNNAVLKVIFENDFLPEDKYKIRLCKICSKYKVEFVKTSTGYGFTKGEDGNYSYKGATVEDVKLMRRYSDPGVQVKAAGGVRTLNDLLKMKELGVTRIGASATAAILDEFIE